MSTYNKVTLDGTTLMDISDTTAVASDVAQGKYFYTAGGVKTAGTASGGGGASNFVTGTFTGTTTGAAMDITLNYTGTGYPISITIVPSEGAYNSSGAFYALLQRYVVETYNANKAYPLVDPWDTSYTAAERALSEYNIRYKSSATNNTSRSASQGTAQIYTDNSAAGSLTSVVRVRTNTKISVFIASDSYGFAANIPYTYYVIYSS